jgi:UDP-glucose 4-epimerase
MTDKNISANLPASFKNKKCLVLGGMGFIGSNLAIRLVSLGADVVVCDSMIDDYGGNLYNIEPVRDKLKINISDVRDMSSMQYIVRNMDYIFNLAGQVSHIESMRDPFTDLEINVKAQLSIMESCRRFNSETKVIFASTRQIYGKAAELPVDEATLLRPIDVNGVNKMAGEWYHILYNNVYGIRTCSLRLTNTYGPRQLIKHNLQGFIGVFIRQAILGEEIKLFGGGDQKRDFTFVEDVVDAFLYAAISDRADGKIFNLGGIRPYSLKEFTEILLDVTGGGKFTEIPFPKERQKIDIGDAYSDYRKIKESLGWEPRVDLRSGLAVTIAYFKENLKYYLNREEMKPE